MMEKLIYAVFGITVGALLWMILGPGPEVITYDNIIVRHIEGEPDTVRTIVDRIVYVEREPELVATQPGGAEDVVEDFCHPDTVVEVLEGDTVWVPADTVYLLRSVVHDPSWFMGRARITVYGPTSAGDLRSMQFASYPGWSLRTTPDVIFREPRFGWFRPLAEALVYIGVGYAGGKIF